MGIFADRLRQAAKQKASDKAPTAPVAPLQNQTAATAAQLQATTGKAGLVQPAVTGQSNIMETVANIQTQQQVDITNDQLQQTAEQMALTEKENEVKQQEFENQRLLKEQEYENRSDEVFQQYMDKLAYNDKDLEDREDQLEIEHAGRVMRLRNAEYKQKLIDVGRREQLANSVKFQEAYVKQQIGHNMSELIQNLDFAKMQATQQRGFNERMLIEDLNTANEIAVAAINDNAQAAMYSGVGSLITGAAKAGAIYANSSDDTNVETDIFSDNTTSSESVDYGSYS